MNFKLLSSSLTRLSPILVTRSPLPVLSCVKLSTADGLLHMEASNLEQHMRISVPYEGAAINCCVGLKRLASLPGDGEVTLAQIVGGELKITGNGMSARLATLPPEEFPVMPEPAGPDVAIEAGYGDSLRWVAMAADKDINSKFAGVCFGEHGMVGTDRRLFHVAEFPSLNGIIVPTDAAEMIATMLDAPCTINSNDRSMTVKSGDTVFVTRLIANVFPDMKPVLNTNLTESSGADGGVCEFDATKLCERINSIKSVWNERSDHRVSLVFGDKITISATSEGGLNVVEVEMDGQLVSGAIAFEWSGVYLTKLLSGFSGMVAMKNKEYRFSITKEDRTVLGSVFRPVQ